MNLNIVIRKNYSKWFDIDVDAKEVLGDNYREISEGKYFDLIDEYVFNKYGEDHDVKMWQLGRPTKEEYKKIEKEAEKMEHYIRIEKRSRYSEGLVLIKAGSLTCEYVTNMNFWINNMPRWMYNDYPIDDAIKYFELINLLREKDMGAEPLKLMNFELVYMGGGKYSLKDERVLSHLG